MINKNFIGIAAGIAFLILSGCGARPGTSPTDTPTSGHITVASDESFLPFMEQEGLVFEATYPDAIVDIKYKSEGEIFYDLLHDSVRFIVACRKLTPTEELFFEEVKITPKTTHIADDGVAFILHKDNPLSELSFSSLAGIFSGKNALWSHVSPIASNDSIRVVFDHPSSANVRFLTEKFVPGGTLPSYCFAVNSNAAVVDYVEKHPSAIGVISVNWVSNKHDSLTLSFLDRIKVAEVSDSLADSTFYGPYQAYIKNGSYPFRREVYIISREPRVGLGTGFASFIAGDKGQRIILKSGIVPAVAPVRIINVNTEN